GSASSSLGSVGQAEYSTANRFMSGFAEARERMRERGERQGRTLTVEWPLWRDGGMEVPAGRASKVLAAAGLRLLDTREALDLLPRLLESAESCLAVLPGDVRLLEKRLGRVTEVERGMTTADRPAAETNM